jgi:predicted DNA-binding transcriptional regulator AlpA
VTQAQVIYVAELAQILGMTEAALRAAYYRQSDAVPPGFKQGRKLAWLRSKVDAWLAAKASKGKKP